MNTEMTKKTKFLTKRIVKVILVLLIACFFFPFCTVSCGSVEEKVTGLDATIGMTIDYEEMNSLSSEEKIDGNLILGLLFVLPVVMLVLSGIVKEKDSIVSNLSLIIGGSADILLLFVFKHDVTKFVEVETDGMCSIAYEPVFYLEFLLNALIIAGGILLCMSEKKSPGSVPERRRTDIKGEEGTKKISGEICSVCGELLEEDSLFCTNCGAKLNKSVMPKMEAKVVEEGHAEKLEVAEPDYSEEIKVIEETCVKEEKPLVASISEETKSRSSGLRSTMRTAPSNPEEGFTKAGDL